MTPQIAALRIGRSLTASEDSVDALLGQIAGLTGELTAARLATGAAAATGHRALARVAAAQIKMIEVRMDLIRAHQDLYRIAETADVPTDCPKETFTGAELESEREAA